jgi:hypothetical protein
MNIRQIEIPTAHPLEHDTSLFEHELIATLKIYKLPCSDQLQANLVQSGGNM